MAETPRPAPDDPVPGIADAEAFFRDIPGREPSPPPPIPADQPGSTLYEVADIPEPAEETPSPPPLPEPEPRGSKPKAKAKAQYGLDPSDAVEQVWSRTAEWGGSLAVLAAASLMLFFAIYVVVSAERYGMAFVVLLLGGGILAVLTYPILITLERPVRVTPEQAVRDYFNALSHHAPHYRRMWLLLSNRGRVSGSFASFEGFRSYWKARLVDLHMGRASNWTPLKFQVEDFRSVKSAGMSEIEADFTVQVLVRGRQQEGPVESFRVSASLVKGPDKMWYLDKGTLP